MVLPRVCPVLFMDGSDAKLADRAEAEGLEVAEALLRIGDRAFGRTGVEPGEPRAHGRRTGGVRDGTEPCRSG